MHIHVPTDKLYTPIDYCMELGTITNVAIENLMAQMEEIDPGEAQIFALAAQEGLCVVTGDKRALCRLAKVPAMIDALEGRVATLEAVLIGLCRSLSPEEVRRRLSSLVPIHKTIRICFSDSCPDPVVALESYRRSLEAEVRPLVIWQPEEEC